MVYASETTSGISSESAVTTAVQRCKLRDKHLHLKLGSRLKTEKTNVTGKTQSPQTHR